ncbi:MAG: hypothetical protein IM504_06225 [Microcystis sp. M038S2]|jgi:hypothetical protein|uniref:hypothetical protein n=1 Tax=unclassified Microcystis TaxID=2643300 RepID=UPI002590808D|nr:MULTISPECIES: hypothetical protein [unclassified Microcystis]NCS48754.1 hypothetical protein [Microcystis aeruginosa BK11-02]MCA2684777.1 hypothetical protein [Microcystis sp. M046S2]MCA2704488.1 hypothetical protein [Microcystis sp. M038S2]MCA2948041.1 hypothetical protein [Microcystis sp. M109S1]MCA2951177.1 hypothetical protein [Microcystis sp. M112S1]
MLTPEKNYLQLEPPNYRKALDDFGVIELLHKLAALTGKDLEHRFSNSLLSKNTY